MAWWPVALAVSLHLIILFNRKALIIMSKNKNVVPKIISVLYLVVLVAGWSLSGWLDDPIKFYSAFYGHLFTKEPIPRFSHDALEHMSVTLTQLYLMYAITIVLLTYRCGQAQVAMLLGNVFCIVCVVGEQLVPMPQAKVVRISGVEVPFLDVVPAIFGVLFLFGFLFASNTTTTTTTPSAASSNPSSGEKKGVGLSTPSRSISEVCKTWAVIYLNLIAINTVSTLLMDPSNMYIHALGYETFAEKTAIPVQLIMMRVGWIVCAAQALMAIVITISVFALQQTQLLYFPLAYYLIHMLYVQLYYPWHPYPTNIIPLLEDGNVIIVPPIMVCAATIVGSLVSLHTQRGLDDTFAVAAVKVVKAKSETTAIGAGGKEDLS